MASARTGRLPDSPRLRNKNTAVTLPVTTVTRCHGPAVRQALEARSAAGHWLFRVRLCILEAAQSDVLDERSVASCLPPQ